ncbi:MAG TPA: carboxypeptidase-like regulatory domain-containing protein [Saprospiraceae bacterium]|jgi:carboxypeptidase-like protein
MWVGKGEIVKTGTNPYLYRMVQKRFFRFMALRLIILLILSCWYGGQELFAQDPNAPQVKIVQISGKVVTKGENDEIVLLPYAVVAVQGTNRGTLTDFSGFYSIVVRTGETLVFSVLGYKDAFYTVPDTINGTRYTVIQPLSKDTVWLPEAVVYPWPDPDFFVQEFLAMDVHDDLEDIAKENLSEKAMEQLREYLPSDGPEHVSLYMRQQSQDYYSEGQYKPQNIFNAFAWQQFIEAWKRGDFKKKDKDR